MRRRRLLRAAGVAGAGSLATWAGLRAGSAPSRAAAELAITGDEADLAADGVVEAVRLAAEIEWPHELVDGTVRLRHRRAACLYLINR
jgi:hypothetical protein